MIEQIEFSTNTFAHNPEPRRPCVRLLNVSGSMGGKPLDELNAALATFREELASDSLATKRVEAAILTFGPTKVELPFTCVSNFYPPHLVAQADTPMGSAIQQALTLVRDRSHHDARINVVLHHGIVHGRQAVRM